MKQSKQKQISHFKFIDQSQLVNNEWLDVQFDFILMQQEQFSFDSLTLAYQFGQKTCFLQILT